MRLSSRSRPGSADGRSGAATSAYPTGAPPGASASQAAQPGCSSHWRYRAAEWASRQWATIAAPSSTPANVSRKVAWPTTASAASSADDARRMAVSIEVGVAIDPRLDRTSRAGAARPHGWKPAADRTRERASLHVDDHHLAGPALEFDHQRLPGLLVQVVRLRRPDEASVVGRPGAGQHVPFRIPAPEDQRPHLVQLDGVGALALPGPGRNLVAQGDPVPVPLQTPGGGLDLERKAGGGIGQDVAAGDQQQRRHRRPPQRGPGAD